MFEFGVGRLTQLGDVTDDNAGHLSLFFVDSEPMGDDSEETIQEAE